MDRRNFLKDSAMAIAAGSAMLIPGVDAAAKAKEKKEEPAFSPYPSARKGSGIARDFQYRDDGTFKVIPTRAKEVYDVSGAGDTVIAASTLALCVKDDPVQAAEIANYAAGVVVGKLGTAACSVEELKRSLLHH